MHFSPYNQQQQTSKPRGSRYLPSVIETDARGDTRGMDPFTRLMKDRVIFLGSEVDDDAANGIIACLLFLQMDDSKKDIHMYINSPGGSITAGLAIYDTMQFVTCDVNTYCLGMAASMGALLLCAGTKGKRYALPNSDIMIHQASGGARGTAADVERTVEYLYRLNRRVKGIISHHTGQPIEKVNVDCDRDTYLTAHQAKEYGLVDEVVASRKDVPNFAELTRKTD
jgi:ATP-dependent Clp protease, protease subunit